MVWAAASFPGVTSRAAPSLVLLRSPAQFPRRTKNVVCTSQRLPRPVADPVEGVGSPGGGGLTRANGWAHARGDFAGGWRHEDGVWQLRVAAAEAIQALHWRDLELLVDLVFRQSRWERTRVLGERMKSIDIERRDPITGDRYRVHVEANATKQSIDTWAGGATDPGVRRHRFVAHSPAADAGEGTNPDGRHEVISPGRLATLVVRAGLTRWRSTGIA